MSKQVKQNTNSNEESLLNKIKQLEVDNFLLSSPQGLTTVGPLPSTSGGNTTPVAATTPTPTTTPVAATPVASNVNPNMHYSQSSSFNWSKPVLMNAEEIAKAEAQKAEEERKANEYNATLTGRINTLNSTVKKPGRRYDDMGKIIPSTYTPMAPLPVMPKEVEIPRMTIANESYGESRREGTSGGGAGAVKRKAPTIASVDWKSGKISPMSPSEVSLDTDGVVQAAMESRNPAFATKAIADNFGDTPLPKGTMVKIPNIQLDKATGKYVNMGEVTVDMGGNSYADNMNRIFTAHMAKYMLNDINKNPKMLKNYGTQGGSQLKFNPSVFVAGQGGVYNSTISKSLRDALTTAGIPPGTTQPVAGSMTSKIVNDKNSKANETWLNAKDNNMLADTVNGWGNSTANALMGYLLGVR